MVPAMMMLGMMIAKWDGTLTLLFFKKKKVVKNGKVKHLRIFSNKLILSKK
jgi:hypothetical protein